MVFLLIPNRLAKELEVYLFRFGSFNYSPRKYKHLRTIERKRKESFKELGVYLFLNRKIKGKNTTNNV